MSDGVYWISFDVMENFMADVLKGVGVPEQDARVCAEVLITSDKRGIDSHGISRLKPIYYDRIKIGIQNPITNFEIVREGRTTAVIDGHDGMGHVISKRAMEMTLEKAKEYGMGMVAVRNSTHYGIAGYYALMAARAGMIGITGSNARPSIAPTFGVENMLGTNPLTFGIPTDEEFPFVLDCATSITQRGKIEVYARVFEEIFGSASIRGRQAVRDFAAGFAKRWIDRELTIYQVVAQGDTVVVVWGFRARRAGSDSPDDTSKAESAWGGVTLFRFNSKDQIAFEIGEESSPGPSGRVPSAFRELVAR